VPTLSRQQMVLLAEAADVMTNLREAAFALRTPKPEQRIGIIPGVADLILTRNQGLETGFYALELLPQALPEGVGESKSPA
jgi:hypothetical protein